MKSHAESLTNDPSKALTRPLWVSPKQASRLTGIGLTRLYELLNNGTLKSIKLGRKQLVSYASLEALGD